jgi:hypothetical protein
MNNREEQERLYNQKYGYQPMPETSLPRSKWRLEGQPGAWEIIDGITVVEQFTNRGHALAALRGYVNGGKPARARYSFRKVYRYLKDMGWRIELNEPPAVWWVHQGSGRRIKENRQLQPKGLLLACYKDVPGGDKETLKGYWTWHYEHARI